MRKWNYIGTDLKTGLILKTMYFRVERYVYYEAENAIGMITRCGEIVMDIDGYYISWYL